MKGTSTNTVRGKKNRTGTITNASTGTKNATTVQGVSNAAVVSSGGDATTVITQPAVEEPQARQETQVDDARMHLVAPTGVNSQTAALSHQPSQSSLSATSGNTREDGEERYADDGSSCSIDYADPDASIRPITPSSIDAASSFTGSSSLHSLAPTSRTFKSFLTGHSKTSASTKPTTLLSAATSAQANTGGRRQSAEGGMMMRDPQSNRIATSLHGVDARSEQVGQTILGQAGAQAQNEETTAERGDEGVASTEQQQQQALLPSSASITFSKLPPTSPASAHFVPSHSHSNSIPSSPMLYPSNASISSSSYALNVAEDQQQTSSEYLHYPGHSANNPKNNPRASSPPPDNASMLTLASSTGGGDRDKSTSTPGGNVGGSSTRLGLGHERGKSAGALSTISYLGEHRSNSIREANEDASIRAIAPSRCASGDSLNSGWSANAAIVPKSPGNVASQMNIPSATDGASIRSGRSAGNYSNGAKRGTPSIRTVATGKSNYYAAPVNQVEVR